MVTSMTTKNVRTVNIELFFLMPKLSIELSVFTRLAPHQFFFYFFPTAYTPLILHV